jgi:hypothetical protein
MLEDDEWNEMKIHSTKRENERQQKQINLQQLVEKKPLQSLTVWMEWRKTVVFLLFYIYGNLRRM